MRSPGGLRRAGIELRLRCVQPARPTPRRIRRQLGRALQKRGRRCDAPTALGPAGRALQFPGHDLVGPRGGAGTVPRPAIGIGALIGRLGQGPVHPPPVANSRRPANRRAHQRMAKRTRAPSSTNPAASAGAAASALTPRLPAARHNKLASPTGSHRRDQEPLRLTRSGSNRRRKLRSMRLASVGGRQPKSAGQLRGAQPPRQLQQRQRVAARLADDTVPD